MAACGSDFSNGTVGRKRALPLTGNDPIGSSLLSEPLKVLLGSHSPVHDHRGLHRNPEILEHLGQGLAFGYVAGQHLGTPNPTAPVQDES